MKGEKIRTTYSYNELTKEDEEEIKDSFLINKISISELAYEFNVSYATVYRIVNS